MTDDGVWPRKISYSHSLSQIEKLSVSIYPLLSFFFWGRGAVFFVTEIIISPQKGPPFIPNLLCITGYPSLTPWQEDQARRQGWRDRLFGSYSDVCLIEVEFFIFILLATCWLFWLFQR